MACNLVKFGQIITPCYGVMPSDPPKFMRPIMLSFRMVSVPPDLSQIIRPYMVS
jgi:hypothetical protein